MSEEFNLNDDLFNLFEDKEIEDFFNEMDGAKFPKEVIDIKEAELDQSLETKTKLDLLEKIKEVLKSIVEMKINSQYYEVFYEAMFIFRMNVKEIPYVRIHNFYCFITNYRKLQLEIRREEKGFIQFFNLVDEKFIKVKRPRFEVINEQKST